MMWPLFKFADYEYKLSLKIKDSRSNMTGQKCENYGIQDILASNNVFHAYILHIL